MEETSNRPSAAQVSAEVEGQLNRRTFLHASMGLMSLGVAGGLLSACGDSDTDTGSTASSSTSAARQDVTFGFSHPFAEIPVVAAVKQLVKQDGEAKGWTVKLDETQAGKLQDQLATLDTWITQKVTAINLAPIEPAAFEATAKRAVDAGIMWTTYGFPMKTSAGGILFPPELSGQVTAKATVDWINANDPEAEVLILELAGAGAAKVRTSIPREMIAQQTKAKVVSVQPAGEQAKGLQVTEDVLQANPNITVVVAHNDDGALGAAEAFRKAGKQDPSKVWIIGQDGAKDALTALKSPDSYFKASAAIDIGRLCREVVGITERALARKWKPGDEQETIKLAPTLIKTGDAKLIDRFLSAYS